MRILYTFGIFCYAFAVRVAALWNDKARQLSTGWKNTFDRLMHSPIGKGKTAWFHVSSLGEFEQSRPVMAAFRKAHPDYKIFLTFFSPSGYEIRKDCPDADFVCYLPPDTRANASRFVNWIQPSIVFFVKYDYWFNYLEQLRLRAVPTYIFSTILRPDQYFFRWYGQWFLRHLRDCFTHIFVQNETSLQLLNAYGIHHCSIAGDTRFDRVHTIALEAQPNAVVVRYIHSRRGKPVLLAGSSWEPDETFLHQYLEHRADLTLILAPHVIDGQHLDAIDALFGKAGCLRYSALDSGQRSDEEVGRCAVLVIDNIGMLASLYQYADVAYIGGGFGRGIHNTLEAITFGKPVVFGPHYRKFQEACDILARGGGFTYADYDQLQSVLDTLFTDPAAYSHASEVCLQYMKENLGSTEKILSVVNANIIHL